jgi:hypothetical protein
MVGRVGTWEAEDPACSRPIAAPLERCAELPGVDLTTIRRAAADVEPYVRVVLEWSEAMGLGLCPQETMAAPGGRPGVRFVRFPDPRGPLGPAKELGLGRERRRIPPP